MLTITINKYKAQISASYVILNANNQYVTINSEQRKLLAVSVMLLVNNNSSVRFPEYMMSIDSNSGVIKIINITNHTTNRLFFSNPNIMVDHYKKYLEYYLKDADKVLYQLIKLSNSLSSAYLPYRM